MTFIHELDISVLFLFAIILLRVLLPIFLLLLEEAPNFKSGFSLGLPRRVSLTNTLWTFPFSLSYCFIHLHHMTGVLLDPSFISLMHIKHFTNTLQTNIALDISYLLVFVCFWKQFSVPRISHNYPKHFEVQVSRKQADCNAILAFGSKNVSLVIHSISKRVL